MMGSKRKCSSPLATSCKKQKFAATMGYLPHDAYIQLRASETEKRPSTDYLETAQNKINASMRAREVNWVIEVAYELEIPNEALYLSVNYMDRYLSANAIGEDRFRLVAAACLRIASKHGVIRGRDIPVTHYLRDYPYSEQDITEMEAHVLKSLKFDVNTPTIKCFLNGLLGVDQECDEFLANYIAELSLLNYEMLRYAPSLIAAASVYLANFIVRPTGNHWSCVLREYALYEWYDVFECSWELHTLWQHRASRKYPAIAKKYSGRDHEYKCVAKYFEIPVNPSEKKRKREQCTPCYLLL